MIQVGGRTLCFEIHTLISFIWNTEVFSAMDGVYYTYYTNKEEYHYQVPIHCFQNISL
jgi:hypothetical protein